MFGRCMHAMNGEALTNGACRFILFVALPPRLPAIKHCGKIKFSKFYDFALENCLAGNFFLCFIKFLVSPTSAPPLHDFHIVIEHVCMKL